LFENEHTESVVFVIDDSVINLDNVLDVEIRIYFNNPENESKDMIIYMNPESSPTPHTGRSIPSGEYTLALHSSDFPNTPYENYLIDYLKEQGRLHIHIESDPHSEGIFYLGTDLKLSMVSCTGWRRWLCIFFCKECFVG